MAKDRIRLSDARALIAEGKATREQILAKFEIEDDESGTAETSVTDGERSPESPQSVSEAARARLAARGSSATEVRARAAVGEPADERAMREASWAQKYRSYLAGVVAGVPGGLAQAGGLLVDATIDTVTAGPPRRFVNAARKWLRGDAVTGADVVPRAPVMSKANEATVDAARTFSQWVGADPEKVILDVPLAFGQLVGESLSPLPEFGSAGKAGRFADDIAARAVTEETAEAIARGAELPAPAQVERSAVDLAAARIVPSDAVQRVTDALKQARPLRRQQEAGYTATRASRAREALRAREAASAAGQSGPDILKAERSALSGEMTKLDFDALQGKLAPEDIDDLFRLAVDIPGVSFWESVTARSALEKMLSGRVPQASEIRLLQRIYGKDLAEALAAQRPLLRRAYEMGLEIANVPRSIMSSFDFSAPFRQGIVFVSKPRQFSKAFRDMFRYAFSEKAYEGMEEAIRRRPNYDLMQESGLAITDLGAISTREERFASNLAERIPLLGRAVRASGRAYTGFLTQLRADVFDDLVNRAIELGLDPQNPSRAQFAREGATLGEDIARWINTATGRGDVRDIPVVGKMLAPAKDLMNALFFSPRLIASRTALLNPAFYVKLDPFVRKDALKSMLIFAGAGASVVSLAALGGAKVERDPRSSDFGKIRSGNTRIDTWGGFQQYVRMAAQLASGKYISATTGKEHTLGEGYKPTTRLDILMRQIESKEAPIASFATDILRQQDYRGQPIEISQEVAERFTPMVISDMYELYQDDPNLVPLGALAAFGFGVQNFEKGRKKSNILVDAARRLRGQRKEN